MSEQLPPSTTRTQLSAAELGALRASLATLDPGPGEVSPGEALTGGLFAAVYKFVLPGGREVAVKVAPRSTDHLLRYEHGIIRTEAAVLRLAAAAGGLPMPALLRADFTHHVIDADYLVTQFTRGVSWPTLAASHDLADDHPSRSLAPARLELGAFMAALHRITAPVTGNATGRFGYPQAAGGASWPEAFAAMTDDLLRDAHTWGVPLDLGRLEAAWSRARWALAQVEVATLAHCDLWPGNILLNPGSLAITGVLDAERALWGDPLLDFVGAQPLHVGAVHGDLIDGYLAAHGALPLARSVPARAPGEHPAGPAALVIHTPAFTAAANVRITAYRLYLAVIMRVEVEPRSTSSSRDREYLEHLNQTIAVLAAQLEA